MVVELTLVFLVATHLRHLLQCIEHRLDNPVIGGIDALSDLECVRANDLHLDATDVRWEVLDEGRNTFPLLAGELRLFDGFDLVILEDFGLSRFSTVSRRVRRTTRRSNKALRRICFFSSSDKRKALPRSSASDWNFSSDASIPTTCLETGC